MVNTNERRSRSILPNYDKSINADRSEIVRSETLEAKLDAILDHLENKTNINLSNLVAFQKPIYLGTVRMGTFRFLEDGQNLNQPTVLTLPTKPWRNTLDGDGGDIPVKAGDLSRYSFGNSRGNPLYDLRWHHFVDLYNGFPRQIFISDRNILSGLSWDDLEKGGFVNGKEVSIDGRAYSCRILTGGAVDHEGTYNDGYENGFMPNEWDRYVMNGTPQNNAIFENAPTPVSEDTQGNQSGSNEARDRQHNQEWHWWNMYSWCKEVTTSGRRITRGYLSPIYRYSSGYAANSADFGFRPALILEGDKL